MSAFYNRQQTDQEGVLQEMARLGIDEKVKREIKANTYNESTNTATLSDAHAHAALSLATYYEQVFTDIAHDQAFLPTGYINQTDEIQSLAAFFFWSGWVCGVERPGQSYSYTHNWPYDPTAGNTPSAAVIIWSIIGSL